MFRKLSFAAVVGLSLVTWGATESFAQVRPLPQTRPVQVQPNVMSSGFRGPQILPGNPGVHPPYGNLGPNYNPWGWHGPIAPVYPPWGIRPIPPIYPPWGVQPITPITPIMPIQPIPYLYTPWGLGPYMGGKLGS